MCGEVGNEVAMWPDETEQRRQTGLRRGGAGRRGSFRCALADGSGQSGIDCLYSPALARCGSVDCHVTGQICRQNAAHKYCRCVTPFILRLVSADGSICAPPRRPTGSVCWWGVFTKRKPCFVSPSASSPTPSPARVKCLCLRIDSHARRGSSQRTEHRPSGRFVSVINISEQILMIRWGNETAATASCIGKIIFSIYVGTIMIACSNCTQYM
jgi:hypothetical protein